MMAKPQTAKQPIKTNEAGKANEANKTNEASKTNEESGATKVTSESQPAAKEAAPAASTPSAAVASSTKKESARPKKQAATKNGSLLPSAYKLEQLQAAVKASGNTENLLLILHHVEEAGGKAEVSESIEAYRMLKTVLED